MSINKNHPASGMKYLPAATALALALGFASTAAAQSNVEVFGQMSLSLTKAGGASTQMATTGFGSGIGFRGREDLGGGLAAFFHMESRFDADTGTSATPFWAEKSVVGFDGSFGTVQFGRFGNAFDGILGIADPFGETVANMGHENALGETKWDNSIGYYTPTMGGLSAAVTVSTKEGTNVRAPYAFNVKYASGPATVGLGFARNGANAVSSTSLAGNYDFGVAKLHGGYTHSSNSGAGNARNMQLGVSVPVSAAGVVKAAYGTYKANTNLSDRENKFGLGYWHTLSKRTLVFTDVARTSLRVGGVTANTNAFDVGIFHKF